jgi:ABC-type uncharacterized transport system permease subunit
MTKAILVLLSAGLYLIVAALLWRALRAGNGRFAAIRTGILGLLTGALTLHAALLYTDLFAGTLHLGLTNVAALIAWAVGLLYFMAVLRQPVESLGIFILPVAATTLLIEWLWPSRQLVLPEAGTAQTLHIVSSLLAYSLLSVAVVQSLVLGLQERALHHHRAGGFLRNLPPLETMEILLFRMIAVGFVLLTLTLASGLMFSEQLFGKPLRWTHHVVLSLIAWGVFGALLAGRWRLGWRGRTAVRMTLIGFSLLVLGYFGSKFVLEVLLRR